VSPHSSKIPVDLMVKGGQGQPRFWELALGGVTRTPLGAMALPVLMSH
jgi:nucleotide-binding universal stress UspA family protein